MTEESLEEGERRRPLGPFVKEEYKDGSYYEGEISIGKRHGRGKFHYTNGGVYEGEWKGG